MDNKFLKLILASILSLSLLISFAACGDKTDGEAEDTETQQISTLYTNEDGKTVDDLNAETDSFYGKWEAKSAQAENLYGNLEVTINEDGTFDGNVTGEDFSGTWKKVDGGLEFTSVYIEGTLYWAGKCQLVIYDDYSTPVVLTKVDK